MRYAVISDIHSNIEAFVSALEMVNKHGADRILCCGDLVGYGPEPEECVKLARSLDNLTVVMGNHDAAVAGLIDFDIFNEHAQDAVELNTKLMTNQSKLWLAELPEKTEVDGILLVHGSIRSPLREYLVDRQSLSENAQLFKGKMCFVGHSHQPLIYDATKDSVRRFQQNDETLHVVDREKYIINAGSVGQPRDNEPKACVMFYEPEKHALEYHRVEYDIEATAKDMKAKGFPPYLYERLKSGV